MNIFSDTSVSGVVGITLIVALIFIEPLTRKAL